MNRRSILKFAAVVTMLACASAPALAAKAEVFTGIVEGIGAGGYDVVSYFSGNPLEGKSEFSTQWKNAQWHFASAENRDTFIAAPEKYAPQYGGYCAYAVSKGYTAKGDPNAWSVVDGKLYLNFNKSVRATWQTDIQGNISNANANWPKVLE
jgi:YHS domain-containing protein